MKKIFGLLLIAFFIQTSGYAQSEAEEVTRLKRENEMLREEVRQTQARAEAAEKNLQRLRYLAMSSALADKSYSIVDNELAGLLALQAYRFNVAHGGYIYENSIFSALSVTLNRYGYLPKTSNGFQETNNTVTSQSYSASPNGKGGIELKDNKTGATRLLNGHAFKVTQIIFSSSGKYMASLDIGRRVLVWSLVNLTRAPRVLSQNWDIQKLEFSTDDSELRITFSNSKIEVWSLNHERMATELEKLMTRNLTKEEWEVYIAPDLPYEKTVARLKD